ncbi:hypothetical protein NPN23_24960, partial [Vibrio parahaemolyticus]|nr:hypothetical protein [Vibrio parahaemolyticus]
HKTIGKSNFSAEQIKENLDALLVALKTANPSSAKGTFLKKVSISTTLGAGIGVDVARRQTQGEFRGFGATSVS